MLEVFCGLACVAAIIVANYAPAEDRLPALACALLILTGWIGFNAPFHRYGFVIWEAQVSRWAAGHGWAIDIPFYATERAARDALCAAAMVWLIETYWRPWLFLMLGVYLAMIGLHAYDWTLKFGGVEQAYWSTYVWPLNGLFVVQLAIIFALGGEGFRDAVDRWWCRRADARRPMAAARQKAALSRRGERG